MSRTATLSVDRPAAAPLGRRPWWESAGAPLLAASVVLALVSAALAWATAAGAAPLPAPVRAALVVLAATALPGVPVVMLLRLPSRALSMALATSLSLATTVLLAQASMVAGAWWPPMTQTVVVLASLGLAAAAWRRLPARSASRRVSLSPLLTGGRPLALLGLGVALLLFGAAASSLDVGAAGALGIITEVGWSYVGSLAVIALVLVAALRRHRPDAVVLVAAAVVLVTVVTTLVSAADGAASVPTAWTHRGLTDVLLSRQSLPPGLDARYSWAGFFSAGAHLVTIAGLADVQPFMTLAPVFFTTLLLAPLFVIGRALTASARTAWVGIVLYLLFNWYQQDYYAPQALALVLHCTVLAVLLWWWRASPTPVASGPLPLRQRMIAAARRVPGVPPSTSPAKALAVEALLVVLIVAVVVSHQLTPLVLIGSLVVFAATGSTRFSQLWVVAGLVFTAWFTFGASDYWRGHLVDVVSDLGRILSSLQGGVADRVGTVPEHRAGQLLRIGTSSALALVAAVGCFQRRGRRGWVLAGALAALPFGLVLVQSYGGEVVIRSFVLASPVLAPLAASALVRTRLLRPSRARGSVSPAAVAALTAVVLALAVVLTATRGLNASFERVTAAQVAVGDRLLKALPAGARVMEWDDPTHLTTVRTDVQVVDALEDEACRADVAQCTIEARPDYVLVTSTHEARGVLQEGFEPGWSLAAVEEVVGSGLYSVEVQDADLTLLRRTGVTAVVAP